MISNSQIESIYNKYIVDLYNYAVHLGADKELAMDAVHDVFYKLCIGESKVSEIGNVKFYLFRALKNRLLNIYKSKDFNTSNLTELHTVKDSALDMEELLISKENERNIKEKIDKLLNLLTKRQREIIYLRYVQGYNYEQIAEIMKISYGSCRKLSHKAMTQLRKHYPYGIALITMLQKLAQG